MHINNANVCVHTFIAENPLPCGEAAILDDLLET